MILNNGCLKSEQKKWNCLHCTSPTLQNNDLFIPFLSFFARIRTGQKHADPCGYGSETLVGTKLRKDVSSILLFKLTIITDERRYRRTDKAICIDRKIEDNLKAMRFLKFSEAMNWESPRWPCSATWNRPTSTPPAGSAKFLTDLADSRTSNFTVQTRVTITLCAKQIYFPKIQNDFGCAILFNSAL